MVMPLTAPPSVDLRPHASADVSAERASADVSAERASAGRAHDGVTSRIAWRTLGRHQLGSLIATLVDFGTMIACVELLRLSPVLGTGIGAAMGGITNFVLGRTWIFHSQSGKLGGQALRYAMVSGASACWNALGEHLVADRAHVPYVEARALVSIFVSLFWNYPMQREFVFHESRATKDVAR
jgi:putative flippase GtrA